MIDKNEDTTSSYHDKYLRGVEVGIVFMASPVSDYILDPPVMPHAREPPTKRFFINLDDYSPPIKAGGGGAAKSMDFDDDKRLFIKSEPPTRVPSLGTITHDDHAMDCVAVIGKHNVLIEGEIGKGSYSVVKRGQMLSPDGRSSILVAIKLSRSDEESIQAANQENRILSTLHHSNIITQIDYSLEGMNVSTILEFASLGSLNRLVLGEDRARWVNLKQFYTWSLQLFSALSELKAQNIVHLDLKPHNVLVCSDLSLRIADFGGSRIIPSGVSRLPLSEGVGCGTLSYAAPELLNTTSPSYFDCSSDIYSAGVILYVMLTGREPFQSIPPQPVKMVVAARQGFFTSGYNPIIWSKDDGLWVGLDHVAKDVAHSIVEVIESCVAKDSSKRPLSQQLVGFFRDRLRLLV